MHASSTLENVEHVENIEEHKNESSARPTLQMIMTKDSIENREDNTFQLYTDSEPIATESVQNRPSRKLFAEEETKQDTLDACLGLDGISEIQPEK
jgi:hypothetical protein